MQRDMDLIRQILLILEAYEHAYAPDIKLPEYSEEKIDFHIKLMAQAGLIEAINLTALNDPSPKYKPTCLTWDGYEFIETAKNDYIWNKAKSITAKVGGLAFELLKPVLISEAKKYIGLP